MQLSSGSVIGLVPLSVSLRHRVPVDRGKVPGAYPCNRHNYCIQLQCNFNTHTWRIARTLWRKRTPLQHPTRTAAGLRSPYSVWSTSPCRCTELCTFDCKESWSCSCIDNESGPPKILQQNLAHARIINLATYSALAQNYSVY